VRALSIALADSAGVLPAFWLHLRADARLEKGAEFFFSIHLPARHPHTQPPNHPPTTHFTPSKHPPPTYLVRLAAWPGQIILKRKKIGKKLRGLGEVKRKKKNLPSTFSCTIFSHSLFLSLGKLWPYWIFSTFFRCRQRRCFFFFLGRLFFFFFLAKCRRFLWAVFSPSFCRVAQKLISLFSFFLLCAHINCT